MMDIEVYFIGEPEPLQMKALGYEVKGSFIEIDLDFNHVVLYSAHAVTIVHVDDEDAA